MSGSIDRTVAGLAQELRQQPDQGSGKDIATALLDRADATKKTSLPAELLKGKLGHRTVTVEPRQRDLLDMGERIGWAVKEVLFNGAMNQRLDAVAAQGMNYLRYELSRKAKGYFEKLDRAAILGSGNCGEHGYFAFELARALDLPVALVYDGYRDHCFIVLDPDSADPVVVDPWPTFVTVCLYSEFKYRNTEELERHRPGEKAAAGVDLETVQRLRGRLNAHYGENGVDDALRERKRRKHGIASPLLDDYMRKQGVLSYAKLGTSGLSDAERTAIDNERNRIDAKVQKRSLRAAARAALGWGLSDVRYTSRYRSEYRVAGEAPEQAKRYDRAPDDYIGRVRAARATAKAKQFPSAYRLYPTRTSISQWPARLARAVQSGTGKAPWKTAGDLPRKVKWQDLVQASEQAVAAALTALEAIAMQEATEGEGSALERPGAHPWQSKARDRAKDELAAIRLRLEDLPAAPRSKLLARLIAILPRLDPADANNVTVWMRTLFLSLDAAEHTAAATALRNGISKGFDIPLFALLWQLEGVLAIDDLLPALPALQSPEEKRWAFEILVGAVELLPQRHDVLLQAMKDLVDPRAARQLRAVCESVRDRLWPKLGPSARERFAELHSRCNGAGP